MSANDSNGRINVSEDRLRAVLAEFELRLITGLSTRFEAKADLIHLTDARKQIHDLEERVAKLERWRSYLAGAMAVIALAAGFYTQYH